MVSVLSAVTDSLCSLTLDGDCGTEHGRKRTMSRGPKAMIVAEAT